MEVLSIPSLCNIKFFPKTPIIRSISCLRSFSRKNPSTSSDSRSPFFLQSSVLLTLSTPFEWQRRAHSCGHQCISASFRKNPRRRNSLRKKLIKEEKVNDLDSIRSGFPLQSPKQTFDENSSLNSDIDSGNNKEISNFSSNLDSYGFYSGEETLYSDRSDFQKELDDWVSQLRKKSEYWGPGSGTIFTIYEDLDGNVERVSVNEDEVIDRSVGEDISNVDKKISHAKLLAREIEAGSYKLPRNSSIARFVIQDDRNSHLTGHRSGDIIKKGHSLSKLSFIGFTVIIISFVFWEVKKLFISEDSEKELTTNEKRMLKRKLKSRIQREKMEMERKSVEVLVDVPDPVVSTVRPQIDKEDLLRTISNAKASQQSSSLSASSAINVPAGKVGFHDKIMEIQAMARQARLIEQQDTSQPVNHDANFDRVAKVSEKNVPESTSDGNPVLVVNYTDHDKVDNTRNREGFGEISKNEEEGVRFPDIPSLDESVHREMIPAINGVSKVSTVEDARIGDSRLLSKGDIDKNDNVHDNTEPLTLDGLTRERIILYNDKAENVDFLKEDERELVSSSLEMNAEKQASDVTHVSLPCSSGTPSRLKPRIITSVEEATEYLSQKGDKPIKEVFSDKTVKTKPSVARPFQKNDTDARWANLSGYHGDDIVNSETVKSSIMERETHSGTGIDSPEDFALSVDKSNGYAARDGSNRNHTHGDLRSPADLSNTLKHKSDVHEKYEEQGSSCLGNVPSSPAINNLDGALEAKPEANESLEVKPCQSNEILEAKPLQSNESLEAKPYKANEIWMERNFDEKFDPIIKRIGVGFRQNYLMAKDKVQEELSLSSEMKDLGFEEGEEELEWIKDDNLRRIVFQVSQNEIAGREPFYLMSAEDEHAFFEGLEKKVEKVNEKLLGLHEWVHSRVENLDYGAGGISLDDPLEKIVPRWKGPVLDKDPEFLKDFNKIRSSLSGKLGIEKTQDLNTQNDMKKSEMSQNGKPSSQKGLDVSELSQKGSSITPKTVIHGSDGSTRAGKKSGKEYWEHTKKWSQEFLEIYNAETDPEIKSVMRDMGKDLDRWITDEQVKKVADLMSRIPERKRRYIEKKVEKLKRECEMFGPQAVVSKYKEYADDDEEDYLWWLDLPYVLCIELYMNEGDVQKIGFYSLEMAPDLELDPKPNHVIAFEDPGDSKKFCCIIQAHMEMIGNGHAFVVARPPKDAFREAKSHGFSVTVIRKGQLQLNIDQTLEEVEEEIVEIGSKMYHDMIMRERSVDMGALMKGVFGSGKPMRRRSKRRGTKRIKH
ncbi:hypothetical protein AMTRI_Chr01g133880 [Amborella trichopoda]